MILDKPYFLKSEKFYTFNKKKWRYELTKFADEKAKKSYKEFYKNLESQIKKEV